MVYLDISPTYRFPISGGFFHWKNPQQKNNDGEQLPFAKPRPTFIEILDLRSALVPDHLDNIKLAKV